MYLNTVYLTDTPISTYNPQWFYLKDTLCYFAETPNLPVDSQGRYKKIVVTGFIHTTEEDTPVFCDRCQEEFVKQLNKTYVYVSGYADAEVIKKTSLPSNYMSYVAGDVQSFSVARNKFYNSRIAIKDDTSDKNFSYVSISSLVPFNCRKGDKLFVTGYPVTKKYEVPNLYCPHCGQMINFINESTTFYAKSVDVIKNSVYMKDISDPFNDPDLANAIAELNVD